MAPCADIDITAPYPTFSPNRTCLEHVLQLLQAHPRKSRRCRRGLLRCAAHSGGSRLSVLLLLPLLQAWQRHLLPAPHGGLAPAGPLPRLAGMRCHLQRPLPRQRLLLHNSRRHCCCAGRSVHDRRDLAMQGGQRHLPRGYSWPWGGNSRVAIGRHLHTLRLMHNQTWCPTLLLLLLLLHMGLLLLLLQVLMWQQLPEELGGHVVASQQRGEKGGQLQQGSAQEMWGGRGSNRQERTPAHPPHGWGAAQ